MLMTRAPIWLVFDLLFGGSGAAANPRFTRWWHVASGERGEQRMEAQKTKETLQCDMTPLPTIAELRWNKRTMTEEKRCGEVILHFLTGPRSCCSSENRRSETQLL